MSLKRKNLAKRLRVVRQISAYFKREERENWWGESTDTGRLAGQGGSGKGERERQKEQERKRAMHGLEVI